MKRILYTIMAALTCISCIHEFPEPEFTEQENDQQGKTKVTFRVTNAFSTRSSVNVDEDIIRNINIYAYRDGKLEEKTYMTSPSVVIMELTKGVNYNIYAVANTGPLSPPVNETQLASFSCSIISIASLKNGIPMSWAQERVQINDNSKDISIALERLVSRIGFQVDASLLNGLKINSVQLKQSAKVVRPFLNGGSYAKTTVEVIDGDMATAMDIDDINNGFSVFLYAMENIQELDLAYGEKIWQRFQNLPWLIGETDRCIIREMTEDDLDAVYKVYAGETITRYMEGVYEDYQEELEYTRSYIQNAYRFWGYGTWIIERKKDQKVIGRIGFNLRDGYEEVELGFVVMEEEQQKGYAYECCKEVLQIGKNEYEFDRIQTLVKEENIPSINLCHKLGFRLEGKVVEKGEEYLRFLYDILQVEKKE